ncbi:unnamed protein product [Cochlearia groenlandica]
MSVSTNHCLSLLTTTCKSLKSLSQIHAVLIKSAVISDHYFAGKLILQCSITIPNALTYARRLLLSLPNADTFMFNTVLRGFSVADDPYTSVSVFVDMINKKKGLVFLDSFSFAFVVKAVSNLRWLSFGSQIHCLATKHGLDTNIFVATTLIGMYSDCDCVVYARKVFDEMSEPNLVSCNAVLAACFKGEDFVSAREIFDMMVVRDQTSWNIMLAGYVKACELLCARKMFDEMSCCDKDDVSYSTMIVGFARNGCFDEAFSCFKELRRRHGEIRANEASLTGVFSACSQSGSFEFGKTVHGLAVKLGFGCLVSVMNALIDMYSRCGDLQMAKFLFETMLVTRNIVSWTSMISCLAMYGHGEDAIRLFDDMIESGVKPDEISFVSVLYACSHAGLVEEGEEYFLRMKKDYDIEPTIEHYGCMVDLYGRAGKLGKAYDFIREMPIPVTVVLWRTLLGACSSHGDIELAEDVRKRLHNLDNPDNSGDLVLLSNVYATAGKWRNVASIRKSMIVRKIKKITAWSAVEVGKTMYKFTAGEKSNDKETNEKLKEVILRLRLEAGYVPEAASVLYDVEEEEKEEQVSKHSEKLALAFALSRLGNKRGSMIKIVKNLRICRDCHIVMKLASHIYGVDIVVRDRNRFHSFKDGSCSCRDYW